MKKVIAIAALSTLVWSCSKKMSTTQSNSSSPNNGNVTSTSSSNGDMKTAPATAPTTNAAQAATPVANTGETGSKVPPATTGADAAIKAGQETYNAKCGRCHGLKVTTDYTSDRWISIMQVMAPKARLDDTEKANVLAYVQANAKK